MIRIDEEVRKLVVDANKRAHELLESNREALVRLAEALLEYETLDQEDITALIEGRELKRESPDDTPVEPAEEDPGSEEGTLGSPLVNPKERPATA